MITLEPSHEISYTNSQGLFVFSKLTIGEYTLKIEFTGYETRHIRFVLNAEFKDFNVLLMTPEDHLFEKELPDLFPSEEMNNYDSYNSNYIPGFFQSSKDVFLKSAAYNFSQAWFKIRGYDNAYGEVRINGIPMNKHHDGRPQWSNWGGLNDMVRNQEFTMGLSYSSLGFGGLLGTTEINTRTSEYRKGLKVAMAATNKMYKNRLMLTYASGLRKSGWAIALSASARLAEEGYIEGTPYKSYAAFVSVEKEMDRKNAIFITGIASWNRRGKSAPMTEEVFQLKGAEYNSYWGLQENTKRNSRFKEIFEPIVMITHQYSNKKTDLKSTLSYQYGHIGNSRLGYQNAMNPDPSYWHYLPSNFLKNLGSENFEGAYLAQQNFIEKGQIDWENLYLINMQNNEALYYVYEDRNEDIAVTFNSRINKILNSGIHLNAGILYQHVSSDNFALMHDMLGGKTFHDINPYAEGQERYNNLIDSDKLVTNGSKFNYNYRLYVDKISTHLQGAFFKKKFEGHASIRFSNVRSERIGKFKNGSYPEESFGSGGVRSFNDFSFKTGLTYKLNGRNLLNFRTGYISKPPVLRNIFSNVRIKNAFSPDLQSEKIWVSELSYLLRNRKLELRLTGFRGLFNKGIKSSYFFAEGIYEDQADFVNELLTNISKLNRGIEWSISYKLTGAAKFLCAGSFGDFRYSNNPNLYLSSDAISEKNSYLGKTNLKGLKTGGGPQLAYSLGIEYNDPDYWWMQISTNYLSNNYLDTAPLLRTSNFYLDAEKMPYIDSETGRTVTPEQVRDLLKQQELDEIMLVNLVGGKSWKINDTYFGFFAAFNNLLGTEYRSGGFEQSRYANYPALKEDRMRSKPIFGPKFWFGSKTTFYLNMYIKF